MTSNSVVPFENAESRDNAQYVVIPGPEEGQLVASVQIGDTTYSVLTPAELDADAILADKRRSSRTSGIEELMDGTLRDRALLNRTILLVAFDAFEHGEIPKPAWDVFRVAVTLRHDELRRANDRARELGANALTMLDSAN